MRKGFTLVEMLVVLFIIALMAALIAFTLPGFQTRSRAAKGGQAVQGWLTYARQRAQYEQAPRGMRFLFETNDAGAYVIRSAMYLEKPDDWNYGEPIKSDPLNPNDPKYVVVQQRDPSDPLETVLASGDVAVGDYFELNGVGQPHLIVGLSPSNPAKPSVVDKIHLADPGLPFTLTSPTKVYRVMRGPRTSGDEPSRLPDDVIIDPAMFTKYSADMAAIDTVAPAVVYNGTVPQYFDVMFAPNGSVMGASGSRAILWVRIDKDAEFDHNPTLVVVTHGSGLVAAYDPVAGAPFSKVK